MPVDSLQHDTLSAKARKVSGAGLDIRRQGENLDWRGGTENQTFELISISFGAAESYAGIGGQPVISDESPLNDPVDLSLSGLELRRGSGSRAIGAFPIGTRTIRIRVRLACDDSSRRFAFIRATFAQGGERVRETPIVFEDGIAEVEFRVVGINTTKVAVIDEDWTWECRAEGCDFVAMESHQASQVIDAFPIRLYFTAGVPLNRSPRESFYHVACSNAGASDSATAEQKVWENFTAFRSGGSLTNARGQRLAFWRDDRPGVKQSTYINRDAQQLVTLTDSSCRGWAELFHEALAIHGISSRVRAVRPKMTAVHPILGLPTVVVPDNRGGKVVTRTIGILFKPFKWQPAENVSPHPFSSEECVIAPSKFTWKIDNPLDAGSARWPQTDVDDLLRPVPASCDEAAKARGLFGNHAVVVVQRNNKETWYDPSFGMGPHDSLLSYENDVLGRGEENPGGLFAIVGWKRQMRENPATGKPEEFNAGLLLGAAPAPATPILEVCDLG